MSRSLRNRPKYENISKILAWYKSSDEDQKPEINTKQTRNYN